MQGAREYAMMFSSGQRGRLYLVRGEHARGKTFHIWVLPSAELVEGMPWSVKDAVEVYGITGGQPGWTETYGWLHRGKWEQDFSELVKMRQSEIAIDVAQRDKEKADLEAEDIKRKAMLLATY
jgi:hypothetical protein